MPGGEEGSADCVKVALRCRPPSTKEINAGETCIVELTEAFRPEDDPGQVILNDPSGNEEPSKFAFDIVFGLEILQSDIYEAVGRPALMKSFEGYNGTIFCYGQTGSGKSWSMSGGQGDLRGIIPRVNVELFERIQALKDELATRKFLVMCSYFEIYNEILFDLLNPVADRGKLGGGLQIKEHPVLGIYVKDLTEIVAEDAAKLEEMIANGTKNRAVSATMMNAVSSRSHSIFTIKIHQKDDDDPSRNVFAKLNLVDLAGSERQKGTGATGQTLKEGANINKSLSALGNVINALVECANGKKVFIPYRNSKLTRVLQESLGGNSLCTMLATLSPAACNYEETMSTLRYANRAKAIKVSATKNEEASRISQLKAEVEELKKKLASGGGGGGGGGGSVGLTEDERETERLAFGQKLKEMEGMLNNNWGEKDKLSKEHEMRMQRLAEERRKAQEAVEEERSRRLRLLEESNDPELSVRGFVDLLPHLPKFDDAPSVLSGELPRQWLKSLRSLATHFAELKEQRTMVSMFKHAFDEDAKLWGEGVEAGDMSVACTGLNRCVPKLEKLRKGGEKLAQLEAQVFSTASELASSVRETVGELEAYKQKQSQVEAAAAEEGQASEDASKTSGAANLDDCCRMCGLVLKQVQERSAELEQLASVELGQTCELVMQFSRKTIGDATPDTEEANRNCEALRALVDDPSLAAMPAGMPVKKPLREYEAGDVLDTPETTEAVVGQLVRWETVCGGKVRKSAQELLSRPPPKFVLDVALGLKAATGWPPGLVGEWPEARDERLAVFRFMADAASSALGCTVDFDPEQVLKGKDVPKTLRLLQLLAVGAARQSPQQATSNSGQQHPGSTRPREMPSILEAMLHCLQDAKRLLDGRTQSGAAAAEEDQSLDEKIRALEVKIEEEKMARKREEGVLADTERQLQEALAELKKISTECELAVEAARDPEREELEAQISHLLNDAADPTVIPEEAVLQMVRSQVEEVRKELERDDSSVDELTTRQQEFEKLLAQATAAKEQLEAEVRREQQRRETEEQLEGQTPEEQKLILEAHEAKLRSKEETLEAQIAQMQAEAQERKAALEALDQEKADLEAKAEDGNLQMQIVQEERDAMREAMEQLWNEWLQVDEDLSIQMQAYINLSERLNAQQDDAWELQSLVEKKRDEVAGLQKNGFHRIPQNGSATAT